MKSLIIILLLSLSAFSQTFVGRAGTNAFFIQDVKRDKGDVTFTGMFTPFQTRGTDTLVIDSDNIIYSTFHANCLSMEFTTSGTYGYRQGVKLVSPPKDELHGVAEKPMVLFYAIDAACKQETRGA
jgi:hypothetical protein